MSEDDVVLPGGNDNRRRRRGRRAVIVGVLLAIGWWFSGLVFAWFATMPHPSAIPPLRELDGHVVEPVEAVATDGVRVRGWLVEPSPSDDALRRAVVLAAGIRGDRTAMLTRARWYLGRGWSTLLVDLRGTGASEATRITMGWNEALDLLAWRDLLGERGFDAVGVHAISLGAAAAVYSEARDPVRAGWDFAVLESCYLDLHEAIAARMPMPRALALVASQPLLFWGDWLLGLDADDLQPVEALRRGRSPVLIVCGDADTKVGPDATRRLFEACEGRLRAQHLVPGAGHVDLWPRGGAAMQDAIAAFAAQACR